MGLTYKKEAQLREQPIIKSRMWRSKSGKHVVFQTIFTEIKPTPYLEKVLASETAAPADYEEIFEETEE